MFWKKKQKMAIEPKEPAFVAEAPEQTEVVIEQPVEPVVKEPTREEKLSKLFGQARTTLDGIVLTHPDDFIKVDYHFHAFHKSEYRGQEDESYLKTTILPTDLPGGFYFPSSVVRGGLELSFSNDRYDNHYKTSKTMSLYLPTDKLKEQGIDLKELHDELNEVSGRIEPMDRCCKRVRVSYSIRASNAEDELFDYQRKERIAKIKESGVLDRLELIAHQYEKLGRENIAKELRKHDEQLSDSRIDKTFSEYIDEDFDISSFFPKIAPQVEKLLKEISIVEAEKKQAFIDFYVAKNVEDGSYYRDPFKLNMQSRKEYKRLVAGAKEAWSDRDNKKNSWLFKDETEQSTLREQVRELVRPYDARIVALQQQKAQVQKPLYELFRLLDNQNELKNQRTMTKQQYKQLSQLKRFYVRNSSEE